jgi:DNA-binding CsgD family transcriptional regulator
LPTTRDAELERWCRSQWQVHAVRRRRPDYREQWPTREAFKEHWPLLAQHLIQAAEMIRNEAAGHHDLLPVPYELLDPPKAEVRDWRKLYAAGLQENVRIGWAMTRVNPLGAVFRLAKLSPLEADAFRLWSAGESEISIARTLHRQSRTIVTVIERAEWKLRALAAQPLEGLAS